MGEADKPERIAELLRRIGEQEDWPLMLEAARGIRLMSAALLRIARNEHPTPTGVRRLYREEVVQEARACCRSLGLPWSDAQVKASLSRQDGSA